MNLLIQSRPTKLASRLATVIYLTATLSLSGCHKAPNTEPTSPHPAEAKDKSAAGPDSEEHAAAGVTLQPDEIQKLGLVTITLRSTVHTPEATGFATVLPHEPIAQGAAELATAVATERQSRSALARARKLAGTPGAMPLELLESAEKQATVDGAALELAQRKLSSTLGQDAPWSRAGTSSELAAVAAGHTKLVRVTFSLGSLAQSTPTSLRLGRINAKPGDTHWLSRTVWIAPADASVPGRSYFAIVKGIDLGEGERLIAWTPVGDPDTGVEIPAAAVVISNNQYWCYVEEKPGQFVRRELDTSMPTAEGYFVREGFSAGDQVVTSGVGQLLARETNPSTEAD